ncbi:anillin-like [Ornithodoros turicata]|uniref:anillin-like n=1 Tax=Ornithodoros turicata TaxID=34597 RepID=UPI003139A9AA
MDEIEAYAKTLVSRTQCTGDMLREASPTSSTRRFSTKRNSKVLRESNDVERSIPEEESPKRVCGDGAATLVDTKAKENHPSEQMDIDEATELPRSPSKAHAVSEMKANSESMSVAARKALFEKAVSKSGSTLPLPRKTPVKPALKQVFSTVKMPTANLTVPLTTAVSLRIEATGVHSSRTLSPDDNSPDTKAGMCTEVGQRRPTPRKLVRTELVIKRIGSDDDSGLMSPLSEKLDGCDRNSYVSIRTPTDSFAEDDTSQDLQDKILYPSVTGIDSTTQTNTVRTGQEGRTEQGEQTEKGDGKHVLKLSCTSILESSSTWSDIESPAPGSSNFMRTNEQSPATADISTEENADVFYQKDECPTHTTATESADESLHASVVCADSCDTENEDQHVGAVENGEQRSMSVEEAKVFDEIDEILNDALGSECSDSGSYGDSISHKSPALSPVKTECQVWSPESTDTRSLPCPQKPPATADSKCLPHTISFYRRHQQSLTPRRSVTERCISPEATTSKQKQPDVPLGDRLRALQDEVMTQQNIISQASQALNLCQASSKFVGSSEQIEGERVLLIATQRRLACLNEKERLKWSGDAPVANQLKGSFKVVKIVLQLKTSFVESVCLNKQGDAVYYFICLIRYGPQVVATQVLSTDDVTNGASLEYDKEVIFSDIMQDFEVFVDVYALKSKKQVIPHDKKYHTMKDTLRLKLSTKSRKSDPKLFLSPAVSSPGGPDAVRSSSFQLMGSVVLNSDVCGEKALVLSKVPLSSPLEEKIIFTTELHADHDIEHKGFLTLFQDIGGFGAWTRLWCYLRGSDIVFWRYPDEEQEKVPIDSINLRHCISKDVHILPCIECARPNSFKLILVRPLEENDVDTITVKKHSTVASITHLFSADTKQEAKVWCKKLGTVLSCIRKWDIESFQGLDLTQLV